MSFDLTKRHLKLDLQRASITDLTDDTKDNKKNIAKKSKTTLDPPRGAAKPRVEALTSKRYANPYMAQVEKRKGSGREVERQLKKAKETLALTNDFALIQTKHELGKKKVNNTALNLRLINRRSNTKELAETKTKRFANKIRAKESTKTKTNHQQREKNGREMD